MYNFKPGIAKGIRRITAVTKEAAVAAEELARSFEGLLKEAAEKEGDALENEVKQLNARLGPLAISAVEKERLKTILETMVDRVKKWKKERSAQRRQTALAGLEELATKAAAEKKTISVVRLDFGMDNKVAKDALDKATKVYPEGSFLLISGDDESGKFGVYSGKCYQR